MRAAVAHVVFLPLCAVALLAPLHTPTARGVVALGAGSGSRPFTKTGPRKPQSPRPEQSLRRRPPRPRDGRSDRRDRDRDRSVVPRARSTTEPLSLSLSKKKRGVGRRAVDAAAGRYPDEEKLAAVLTTRKNEKYDPEYSHDIADAKRRLFELRMRKSQRLPFKSSEFRELRKFVARLKTRQREDELRAAGVDLRKRQPRTRRERRRAREKAIRKEANRKRNREILIRKGLLEATPEDDVDDPGAAAPARTA